MRTIGIQQMMSATLYRDDEQLDAFTRFVARQHVEAAGGTIIGEPRVAYHFGQLVHAADCTRSIQSTPTQTVGECSEDCAIVDCDEDAATVVMMRVEVDVDA